MAVIYLMILVGIYIFLYVKNSQIAEPDGCDEKRKECRSCGDISCFGHPVYHRKEREKNI